MGRSGWYGQSIRHSLAARGIRIKTASSIYDVRGVEGLVESEIAGLGIAKHGDKVTDVNVGIYDWDIVVDASRFREKPSAEGVMAAPSFVLGFDGADRAYVFVGRGGTFVHPSGYRDNHYMEPVGYRGQAILLANPVELYALTKEGGKGQLVEVPFTIAGFVGLEGLVNKAHTSYSGHRKNGLTNTAKLGV